MNDGLNIREISPPIFGASRVRASKRGNPDSKKKHFQKHFDDEKENKFEDDSDGGKLQESLDKDLGKRIDIHV
jgi:hypothetical protein